jgi:hypothetical protein
VNKRRHAVLLLFYLLQPAPLLQPNEVTTKGIPIQRYLRAFHTTFFPPKIRSSILRSMGLNSRSSREARGSRDTT